MFLIAINAIGVIGTLIIVLAFFLLEHGKLKSDQMAYPVLNLVGAVMILVTLPWYWNLATLVIEVFWILISLYGIIKIQMKKGQAA